MVPCWISQASSARRITSRLFGGKSEGGVAAYEDVARAYGKLRQQ